MTDLNELADLCERATGPDRVLDLRIAEAVGEWRIRNRSINIFAQVTASIDAAMTLADGLVLIHLSDIGADGLPCCRLGDPSTTPARQCVGIAHTLPLAICAAALRARAATPVQVNEVVGS